MPKTHKNIRVSGVVQGVGYRFSALAKARALDLAGFIRNEPDGTVYMESEGDLAAVEQFIEWCQDGPFAAEVHKIQVKDGPLRNFDNFKIKSRGL